MRSRSLPLFAIKDHVTLDVTFRTQAQTQAATVADRGKVCCVNQDQADQAISVSVPNPNVKFHADLLIFSDDQIQMQGVSKQTFSESGLHRPSRLRSRACFDSGTAECFGGGISARVYVLCARVSITLWIWGLFRDKNTPLPIHTLSNLPPSTAQDRSGPANTDAPMPPAAQKPSHQGPMYFAGSPLGSVVFSPVNFGHAGSPVAWGT